MRWDALFRDLEAQAVELEASDWRAEVAQRTRGERASIELAARVAAARGRELSLSLRDGSRARGVLTDSGGEWLLLDDSGRERLVPAAAIAGIVGLPARAEQLSAVEERLTIASALRALSRDRARVQVRCGVDLVGMIERVGADHLDLAAEPQGSVTTVPLSGLLEVASG
ncbi:hypothetical protein [Demequina sp. NBRC 110056]|uniref:hypothetical protein n=1 Tax=Demequina sp. NBRC 110056 TaxID=1570345 RepID=UPI000A05AA78|nr:hypothetical protein [Demequina sp. NBRC 110056]